MRSTFRTRSYDRDDEHKIRNTLEGILPNNVVRRFIFPACKRLGLPRATWLTFRRTYSSWSHDRGVPGKVVAQLMGHANVDTTLNVYTQVLDGSVREAVEKVGGPLFTIVHKRARKEQVPPRKLLRGLVRPARLERATSWFVARRSIQLS